MVSGEIDNPSKTLPRAIHTALPTVITCFLLANISYYVLVPWSVIGLSDHMAVVSISNSGCVKRANRNARVESRTRSTRSIWGSCYRSPRIYCSFGFPTYQCIHNLSPDNVGCRIGIFAKVSQSDKHEVLGFR